MPNEPTADIVEHERLTLKFYYAPFKSPRWDAWFVYTDPAVREVMREITDDYAAARERKSQLDTRAMDAFKHSHYFLVKGYKRAVLMYDRRLEELHKQGKKRMALFWVWRLEMQKEMQERNTGVMEAIEATVAYLEDEYAHRKVDFETALYAVLVQQDPVWAGTVLDDLIRVLPWTQDVVRNLRDCVVDYSGPKKVNGGR